MYSDPMLPEGGSPDAGQAVYEEMRRIAAIHLSRGVRSPSIQPTVLVHEAWLRLSGRKDWKSKTHFLALASRTMRGVMIDAARARMAKKRQQPPGMKFGEPGQQLPLDRLLELDRVLGELAGKDERKARVVEMRFFGGLEFDEIAEALEVSTPTAKRDWEFARVWIFSRLTGGPATAP